MAYDSGKDLEWVKINEKELLKQYGESFILVHEQKVDSSYKRINGALVDGLSKYGEENFLVYHLMTDEYLDMYSKGSEDLIADMDLDFLDEEDED